MSIIELQEKDTNRKLYKDILFFHYAETGAMGNPGDVIFIKADGKIYRFNYLYGEINIRKKLKHFPCFEKRSLFGIGFGKRKRCAKKWKHEYLGAGNHLLIHQSIYPSFKALASDCKRRVDLYKKWIEYAEEALILNKI